MDNWLAVCKWTLIFIWIGAFLTAFLICWLTPNRLRINSGGLVRGCLSIFFALGAAFSIMGVATSLAGSGLIPESLKWFLEIMVFVLMAALTFGRKGAAPRAAGQKE